MRSAVQASVAPEDKMLPSSAYVGVLPRSQASVAETSGTPSGTASTGVITDDPVPYVALACPTSVQPCPNSAACESASTARSGVWSRMPGKPATTPKPRSDASGVGRTNRGTPKMSKRSGCQSSSVMSYSRVPEALPASQRWAVPPVNCQISQESTVPTRTSASGTSVGRWSRIQRIFGCREHGVHLQCRPSAHEVMGRGVERGGTPGGGATILPADRRPERLGPSLPANQQRSLVGWTALLRPPGPRFPRSLYGHRQGNPVRPRARWPRSGSRPARPNPAAATIRRRVPRQRRPLARRR